MPRFHLSRANRDVFSRLQDRYMELSLSGGHATGNRDHVREQARLNSTLFNTEDILEDFYALGADDAWRRAEKAAEAGLMEDGFCYDGLRPLQRIAWYDETAPGNYRSILTKYATVEQYGWSVELKIKKAGEATAKAEAERELYEAMKARCPNGDIHTLIVDLAVDQEAA